MRCDKCNEKAIYSRRYSGQKFCNGHFEEYFEGKVRREIINGKLIEKGQRIGVGLSGGKDSITLLYILGGISNDLDLEVHAISVDEGIVGYREGGLRVAKKFCSELEVPWHVVSFKDAFGKTLDEMVEVGELGPCTYCGVFRRKLLNEKARELAVEKLATGHNLDDEVQAIAMNYIRGDIEGLIRLGRGVVNESLVRRIKPLREMPEKEVALFTILNDFNVSFDECPYADESFRGEIRDFINQLESNHPGIKFSILRGYEKILPSLDVEQRSLRRCIKCGGPTPQDICKACALLDALNQKLK
ncbi:MAG: TIGR00269 family protein [Candidatus Hydrothermarchaeales archaeon]